MSDRVLIESALRSTSPERLTKHCNPRKMNFNIGLLWTIILLGAGEHLWVFTTHTDICSLVNAPMFCTCDVSGPNQAHTVSCFIFAPVTPVDSLWTGFSQQQDIRFLTLTSRVNSSLNFIPTVALRRTPHLESVIIHDGHLETLWAYSFVNMTHLRNISLERNDISSIELFTFAYLPNLNKLVLSENQIVRLPAEAFYRLPKMKSLYMDRNNLSIIDDMAFVDVSSLEELELNDNSITVLTSKTFQGLGSLKHLDLCRNKITRLVDNVFSGTPSLNELDLHDNLIEDISEHTFKGLHHLNSLKLNSNRIKNMMDNVFMGTPNLMVVDITRNRLKTFRKEILDPLVYSRKIQFVVFLRENPLQCSCDILWISDYAEKNPSHLFRREVRHLKCRKNNTNVRINKLSAEELGCSKTVLLPTTRVPRPKHKPPKRSNPAQKDMPPTPSSSTELSISRSNGSEYTAYQEYEHQSLEVQSTTSVAIVHSHKNISLPYGAEVKHRDQPSSSTRKTISLLFISILFNCLCLIT